MRKLSVGVFRWVLSCTGDKELVQALVLDGEITQIFYSQESRWAKMKMLHRVVAGKTCSRSLVSSFPLSQPVADSPGGRSSRGRTRQKRTTTTTQTIRESRKFLIFDHNYHWTLLLAGILPTWIARLRMRCGTSERLSITTTTQAASCSLFLSTSGTPGQLWWRQLMLFSKRRMDRKPLWQWLEFKLILTSLRKTSWRPQPERGAMGTG